MPQLWESEHCYIVVDIIFIYNIIIYVPTHCSMILMCIFSGPNHRDRLQDTTQRAVVCTLLHCT